MEPALSVAYHVRRATSLNGPWTDLETVMGPESGLCMFDDTNAPSGQAFYQLVIP